MYDSVLERRLQTEIEGVVEKNKDVFSAVIGISDTRGDFNWAGAAGITYSDQVVLMTPETPIFIASITKMYTAATTMIFDEQGLLSLDDPASAYLPETLLDGIHLFKGRDYSNQLRVYHLVSQTSGLPDYFLEKPEGGKSVFGRIVAGSDEEWGAEDAARIAKGLPAKFPPEPKHQENSGKKASYSDTNYQLLGAVIESVAEKPLGKVIAELIVEPLELSFTYMYGDREVDGDSNQRPANIYFKTKPLHLDKAMRSFGPDGGMVSTVGDSLKFIKHFMEGKLFTHPTTLPRMKNWKRIFSPFEYGLGLMRFKLPKILSPFSSPPDLIGHSGSTSAFLFHSANDQLYIAGTLNQIENQRRPVQVMLKILNEVSKGLS